MSEPDLSRRSPELMKSEDTGLLVIDVQERLVPAIRDHHRVVWNIRRLIDGAKVLGVPVVGTEQYPKGLGKTVSPLAELLGKISSKLTFSCSGCVEELEQWQVRGIRKLLVCGMETHVCVAQSVLDLLAEGWRVYVAVDAVGSRYEIDHQTALRRMECQGAVLTSTEAALFEWCHVAGTPQFKQISLLVREAPPNESQSCKN